MKVFIWLKFVTVPEYFTQHSSTSLYKLNTGKDTRHWWSSYKHQTVEEIMCTVFKKQTTHVLATQLKLWYALM